MIHFISQNHKIGFTVRSIWVNYSQTVRLLVYRKFPFRVRWPAGMFSLLWTVDLWVVWRVHLTVHTAQSLSQQRPEWSSVWVIGLFHSVKNVCLSNWHSFSCHSPFDRWRRHPSHEPYTRTTARQQWHDIPHNDGNLDNGSECGQHGAVEAQGSV